MYPGLWKSTYIYMYVCIYTYVNIPKLLLSLRSLIQVADNAHTRDTSLKQETDSVTDS